MAGAPIDIEDLEAIGDRINDWEWRINNLYRITDKDGQDVEFHLNEPQATLFQALWYRNIILKARQLGFTTFMLIFMLDAALFGRNVRCGLIAHTKPDAQRLFREKLKYAYDHLPGWLRDLTPARNDTAGELVFENGSSITVSTSFRGGTMTYLHISEFGKICRKTPDKANEIVTGAFEAVGKNCVLTIESTAEGRQGYFFEYCQEAQKILKAHLQLTRLDYKFFFFPWYLDPEYRIGANEARDVAVPKRLIEYFVSLRKDYGILLDREQMYWYVLKERSLGADMMREYPTTPEEAFYQSVEGAYYRVQFNDIFEQRRITHVPHQPGVLVHTIWDLGVDDANAIWFVQRSGREWHVINFYENNDVGVDHYARKLSEYREEHGYHYGVHVGPHDLEVREWGNEGKTRLVSAREQGVNFKIATPMGRADGIEAVRRVLPLCWFDEVNTEEGVAHLQDYRKEWDDKHGVWKDTPAKGPANHAADSFRYFAVSLDVIYEAINEFSGTPRQQTPPRGAHY